jgi:Tol biopolymer transport system component
VSSAQWHVYRYTDKLLFERRADGQVYTLQTKGEVQNALFSPNGRWLAYSWRAAPDRAPSLTLVDLQTDASGAPSLRQIEISGTSETWAWSPQGKLLRIRREDGKAFMLWSAADERVRTFSVADTLDYYSWQLSSTEQMFLYFTHQEIGNIMRSQLHIADLTGVRASYPLPTMPSQIIWSPHDRHVALTLPRFPRWQLAVADAEGNWHDVALVAQRGDALSLPLAFWSADGETLFYLQDEGASPLRWHWVAYRVAERSYRRVVQNVVKRPYFARRNPQQAVFIWEESGKRNAALMDLDGSRRAVLAEAADDMGDPYWSPDGKYAALVWATGQGSQRVVRLTVANAQTGEVQTLSDGLWDAHDLRWVGGSASLFFIAERSGVGDKPVYSAELLLLGTGEHRVLLSGKRAIGIALLSSWDSIQFWWREGEWLGVERYTSQGEALFAYRVSDQGSTPVLKEVRFLDDQTFMIDAPFPQVFPAPNSDFAALKAGMAGAEQLYIVAPDGSWRLVREGLSGLGNPLWSPDGAALAFTQSVNQSQTTLEIVKANGASIRRVEGYDGWFGRLKWTQCGFSE